MRGLALSKQNICDISHKKIVWQLNNDRKSLELYYECLK